MKTSKSVIVTGKRKKSIARAAISPGKGRVRVNRILLSAVMPKLVQLRIKEPLILAGEIAETVDIDVNVTGGGVISQADAARTAISRALVEFTKDNGLREIFVEYDRSLMVSDMRQRETRKPNTHGNARGKVQKSYR